MTDMLVALSSPQKPKRDFDGREGDCIFPLAVDAMNDSIDVRDRFGGAEWSHLELGCNLWAGRDGRIDGCGTATFVCLWSDV